MNKVYVKILGIHCSHCENKIREELVKNQKVKEVKIIHHIAHISY